MAVYSHSRLSTFEQCPRKYKFKYVEHFDIGDRQSVEGYLGHCVHKALERLYELVMAGKIWSEEEFLGYYEQTWDEEKPDELFIKDEVLEPDDYRRKGRDMLSAYYRMYHPFDQEKTVALERNVVVNLDEEGVYRVRGIIDRLAVKPDGTIQIHDYKTGQSMVNQQWLEDDRQLAIYQIGAREMWPDREDFELVWHYLAVPEKRVSSRTEKDLQELVDSTIQLIREIEQARIDDNFPTNETKLCSWCEYHSFCPAKIHPASLEGKEKEDISNDVVVGWVDRISEIKKYITELENEESELKARIAQFAKEKGYDVIAGTDAQARVQFGDRYVPKFSEIDVNKEIERKKFIEFLIRTGLIEEVFSYHAGSFDSFIKKAKYDPKFKEELFDLIRLKEKAPVVRVTKKRR